MNSIVRFLAGRPRDWHLRRPTTPRMRLGWHLLGPLAVIGSCLASWPAFASATGEGSVALGLWVGAVSILLMAWSFILALRPRFLEALFGGLDSMYRVHRWAGTLAIAFMWLHTSIEPEIQGGIRGASRSLADTAEDLAGTGQTMLYILVGLSLIRLFPYRIWRWTHKLLGVPFAFACWHFYTAEKTYANGSAWGWWFGSFMVAGLVTWIMRVVGRDAVARGVAHKVVAAEHIGSTTRLELAPTRRPLRRHAGQFAFVKLDAPGLREPHPFTIASAPSNDHLEFWIRHLGDWSASLPESDLIGTKVMVEGPYGEFEPTGDAGQQSVWIAGGVGITPFLSILDGPPDADSPTPVLLYAVRDVADDPIVDRLRDAQRAGRVDLRLFISGEQRLTPDSLDELFPGGMSGTHVALCGPSGLVSSMAEAAHSRGARSIETEDFDIRQGFGPERSQEIDAAVRQLVSR